MCRQIMAGGAAGETLDLLGRLDARPSSHSYTYSNQTPILGALEGQQKLTIFYSGIVNVYENVPAHKAHAIMLLLAYGRDSGDQKCSRPCVTDTPEPINYSGVVSSSRTSLDLRPTSSITSSSPAAAQKKQLQRRRLVICKRSQADLPFARKASLARFLKRRNRMSH